MNFKRRMLVAKETAQGMNWLHKMQPAFLHLDLKTMNLLVDENFVVKVSDFGLAQMKNKKYTGKRGSPLYMSPEMLLDETYNSKADVYSFGIVLWELTTLKLPYNNKFQSFDEMLEAVCGGDRPDVPPDTPKSLANLMVKCWDKEPSNRPSFDDMLKSNIFDNMILEGCLPIFHSLMYKMWNEKFLGQWSVPWKEFLPVFVSYLNISFRVMAQESIHFQLIKAVLVDEKDDVVHIENFAKFLEWFGPIEKGMVSLERVYNLLSRPFFHGMISTTNAEKALAGKKSGTYLVRFSNKEKGAFSISVINEGIITHFRCNHKPGTGFIYGGSIFKTMDDLLGNKQAHKSMKPPMIIKAPLTPTPFAPLLNSLNSTAGVYSKFESNP